MTLHTSSDPMPDPPSPVGSFEEARHTTLALIPRTLDPLIRVRTDSSQPARE